MALTFQTLIMSISFLMIFQTNLKNSPDLFKKDNSFFGKVIAVLQGDLVTIELDNKPVRIRLAEIDSPEPRQLFSRQAHLFTEKLALNKTVKVTVRFMDQFKRVVGLITLPDGRILNNEVVRWGYAWHYRVSPMPNPFLAQLEYQAWEKKLGFWIHDSPVPPWKFRAGATIPNPPESFSTVDYDRIFEYGLIGNKKTRIYMWPACQAYQFPKKKNTIIFTNKQEAENMGYRAKKTCSK